MSIAENSIFAGFFLRLWCVLTGAWSGSNLGRALNRIGRAVVRWV